MSGERLFLGFECDFKVRQQCYSCSRLALYVSIAICEYENYLCRDSLLYCIYILYKEIQLDKDDPIARLAWFQSLWSYTWLNDFRIEPGVTFKFAFTCSLKNLKLYDMIFMHVRWRFWTSYSHRIKFSYLSINFNYAFMHILEESFKQYDKNSAQDKLVLCKAERD